MYSSERTRLLSWSGPGMWKTIDSDAERPDVIDSWLLDDGRVRALDLHFERFRRAVSAVGGPSTGALAQSFLSDVVEQLPDAERWFPRIEFTVGANGPHFRLRLRPDPKLEQTIRVWVDRDSRQKPAIKGADLDLVARRRDALGLHHSEELLLTDESERLLEGASTSLLWWQDQTLHTVPDEVPVLESVTRSLILSLARERQVPIQVALPTPLELEQAEVWLVNSLHGIRLVTHWLNRSIRPGPGAQVQQWRSALAELSRPI